MRSIIFSRDRAMQLDAFLRSYERNVQPYGDVDVLYLATSERHQKAYDQVFGLYNVIPHPQTHSFYHDLMRLLPNDGHAILFADDHFFVREWQVEEREVNLHLGLNLTYCYTMNRSQPLPPFDLVGLDKVTWRWSEGRLDWGYPLALCGQVFYMEEMRPLIASLAFHSPNSLESALQSRISLFRDRKGLCYRESKLVLLPWNLVQTDYSNRVAANMPSVDQFLDAWEEGLRINVVPLYETRNESVHQELPLIMERR